MSEENEKYSRVLPPLEILTENQKIKMISELKKLDFFPEKSRAAWIYDVSKITIKNL